MALDRETLKSRLLGFDGRALTVLGEIEADCAGEDGYLDLLLSLGGEPEGAVSNGATWLLKSWLEKGNELSPDEVAALCSQISSLDDWMAQLHICQSIGHMTIGAGDAASLVSWLTPLLTHERPFLRAWALDALCCVAVDHSEYLEAARAAHQAAAGDAAASVRARSRNIKL